MNSIYISLNNNRNLFTNEILNCVFQEILTPSLGHLLTSHFAKAIFYEMRRQLINNQLQWKWQYGRGIL
jgi:RsiW-degrading membrane proteinase PrsW (M82 family)